MENKSNLYKKVLIAQSQVKTIAKDGKNPHFKSAYATLPEVLNNILPILKNNNLLLMNSMSSIDNNKLLTTKIIDVDTCEFIETTITLLLVKNDMQNIGSAITYAQRYNVLSLLGLCPDLDDDANSCSINETTVPEVKPVPVITNELENLKKEIIEIGKNLKKGSVEHTELLNIYKNNNIDEIKAILLHYASKK